MNAGSISPDTEQDGWPTPQILRLVAEQAADCQEALEIVREVVGQGWYTNGSRGSIWFFADRERALIVENTRHDLDYHWIAHQIVAYANDFFLPGTRKWAAPDAETNTRYRSARDGAAALDGRVTPFDLLSLGRDEATKPRAMCSDSTVSGFTAVVGAGPLGALVCPGNPASGLSVPLFVEATGVPGFVMDGSLWAAIERRRAARVVGASVPDVSATERQILDEHAEVVAGCTSSGDEERASLLTDASAAWAVRAFHALAGA